MRLFIIGGSASGKSAYAGRLAEKLAAGRPILYIATMPEQGEGAAEKIRRHEELRQKGNYLVRLCLSFSDLETLCREMENADEPALPSSENGTAHEAAGTGRAGGCSVILFDSLDGFLADVMFAPMEQENMKSEETGDQMPNRQKKDAVSESVMDTDRGSGSTRELILKRLEKDLDHLNGLAEHLITVTDDFYSDGTVYDPETEAYIALAGGACVGETARSDAAVEVVCGIPVLFYYAPDPEKKAPQDSADPDKPPVSGRRALYEYLEIPYYSDVSVHEDPDAVH